jgi:hypothetical protein
MHMLTPLLLPHPHRSYPWGSELLAALKAVTPPPVSLALQTLQPLPGGRGYSCQVTLTKAMQPPSGFAAGGGPGAAAGAAASASFSPCKLLVGCSSTDKILLLRTLVIERFESPL